MRDKQPNRKALLAGLFWAARLGFGVLLTHAAAATFTDANWTPLGPGIDGAGVGAVVGYGSNIYVGGYFLSAGGTPANSIARWNGSSWSTLGSGLEGVNGVHALAVSGGDVYAGGEFTTAGGK